LPQGSDPVEKESVFVARLAASRHFNLLCRKAALLAAKQEILPRGSALRDKSTRNVARLEALRQNKLSELPEG